MQDAENPVKAFVCMGWRGCLRLPENECLSADPKSQGGGRSGARYRDINSARLLNRKSSVRFGLVGQAEGGGVSPPFPPPFVAETRPLLTYFFCKSCNWKQSLRPQTFTETDQAGIEWRYSVIPTTGQFTRVRVSPTAANPQIGYRTADSGQRDDLITAVPEGEDRSEFMARWLLKVARPNSLIDAERMIANQFRAEGVAAVHEAAVIAFTTQ